MEYGCQAAGLRLRRCKPGPRPVHGEQHTLCDLLLAIKQRRACLTQPADILIRTGSFWAIPDGTPPKSGWPVYVDFLAQPYANTTVFTSDPEANCGNGWLDPDSGFGPPSPPECLAFLGADTGCPRPKFQAYGNISEGEAACRTCIEELGNITAQANCTMETSYTWCQIDPKQSQMPGAPNYRPFDTPLNSLASCFLANGSWNTGGGFMSNDGCTFNQFAGELWNARSHQLMLANGIAVVQLNPYTADTWEWYTPDLPVGGGLDQPYLQMLFEMMHDGSYGNLGKGVLDISKLIVAGYSSGAQMASCA